MVKFEESSPEEQPGLVRSQWYNDAGVRRGVDPEVAADIGYKDPAELATQPAAELDPNEAAAARRMVDDKPKRYQTAAERRQLELEQAKKSLEQSRQARAVEAAGEEAARKKERDDKILGLLRDPE